MSLEKKISLIQAKILRLLFIDGRQTVAEIAEKTGISKEIVSQNYLQIKRDGIIRGATIHFNYRGFGYFAVAHLLVTVDPKQVDQIIDFVGKMEDIYSIYTCGPRGNFRVVATLKELKQLDEIKDKLKQRFSIQNLKTVIWTDVREMHENLLLTPNEEMGQKKEAGLSTKNLISKLSRPIKIDETDLKIVDALSSDGRISFSKIAEKTGISVSTIKKRYERLRRNGMMKVTIQINPSKLGYKALAVFFISFTPQTESLSIVEEICKIPDVISVMKTGGDYDLQVYAMIRDIDGLLKIQDEFAEIQGIAKIEMDLNKSLEEWPTPRQYISTF